MRKTKVMLTIILCVILSTLLFGCASSVFPDHRGEEGYVDEDTYVHAGVAYKLYEDYCAVIEIDPSYTMVEILPEIDGIPVTAIDWTYSLFDFRRKEMEGCMLCSIIIPPTIKEIYDSAFKECYKLVEVCNLSSLNIEIGSKENGYIGYYAKDIYKTRNYVSKIRKDDNGFIFYENDTDVILLGYKGNEKDIVIPNNVTEIRGAIATGIDSLEITIDIKRDEPYDFDEDIDVTLRDAIILTAYINIINKEDELEKLEENEESIETHVAPFRIYVDSLETVKTYARIGMEYCIYANLYIDSSIIIPEELKLYTDATEEDGVVVEELTAEYVEYGTTAYNGNTYTRYILKINGELQELPEDALVVEKESDNIENN